MSAPDVARYYDSNTRRFLLMGSGRGTHSMHRELWGPGVGSAHQAADYINSLIAEEIARLATNPTSVIVDFGCGVGGTLFYLADRFPRSRLRGITISRRQVEIAERLGRELGHAEHCSFSVGDFRNADPESLADAIVAVESFVHSDSAEAFLANADRHLRPGACLLLADDFLAADRESLEPRQLLQLGRFQSGWRVPGVCTAESLIGCAAERGLTLERNVDLTGLTRPGSRVRDRLTALLGPALARLGLARIPFCGNLIGGNALQIGLRDRFLAYRLLVFRKRA